MKTLSFCSLFALTLAFAAPAAAQPDLGDTISACCGPGCCLIDGVEYAHNVVNPANSCEMCAPGECRAWTNVCDAGPPGQDAGPTETDAGPTAEDAGPTGTDSGPPETDAGSTGGTDAGSSGGIDAGMETGGGGCSVAHSDARSFSAILALAALGLFLRRREG